MCEVHHGNVWPLMRCRLIYQLALMTDVPVLGSGWVKSIPSLLIYYSHFFRFQMAAENPICTSNYSKSSHIHPFQGRD